MSEENKITDRKPATQSQLEQKLKIRNEIQAFLALALTTGFAAAVAAISPKQSEPLMNNTNDKMIYVYEINTNDIEFFEQKQDNENYKLLGTCERQEPFSLYQQFENGVSTGKYTFDVKEPFEYDSFTYKFIATNPYAEVEMKGKAK